VTERIPLAEKAVVANAVVMPDETYTHGHHDSVLRSHRWRTAENSAAYLVPHLHSGLDLLDVGCGPGTITIDLAALVSPGRTRGVDASADVIEAARRTATERGVDVEFTVGNAYALELDDASVDVVHAHQVLQHLADPVAALAEWRRVLKPGGLLAARDSDYSSFAWHPAEPLLDRWMELYQAAARANRGEPDAGRMLLAWARRAGWTNVTATASIWCFANETDRTWWADVWAERVSVSALADQLRAEHRATSDELHAIAAAWRRWAGNPDAFFMVPHGEIIARLA
jgi:ubiquinone/menaquinone biosynthesis C-methylase UbiE